MKFLTWDETQQWLAPQGVVIDGMGFLNFPVKAPSIMSTQPNEARGLGYDAYQIAKWLPAESECLFWITRLGDSICTENLMSKVRIGCGESRHIGAVGGHLFEIEKESELDMLAGFIFLIISSCWYAYIVSADGRHHIFLGDQFMEFSSPDEGKINAAKVLVAELKLRIIQKISEAW